MKTIAILQGENETGIVNYPAEPFSANAIKIVSNGTHYTIYEEGDELPPELPVVPQPELTDQEKMQLLIAYAQEMGLQFN